MGIYEEKMREKNSAETAEVLKRYLNEELQYLYERIRAVENRVESNQGDFYNFISQHTKNHLPNPSTPSDMEGALKALGLLKDYTVEKRRIYANLCKNDAVEIIF